MPVEAFAWVADPLTFGLAALIVYVFWQRRRVDTGQLVPRATVDTLIEQLEARLAESREREQTWQEAFETNEETVKEMAVQIGRLIVIGETTEALLRAMPSGREHPR